MTSFSFRGRGGASKRSGFSLPALLGLAAFLAASLGAGAMGALANADVWPEFRGPTGQGISEAREIPLKWSATENVKWSVAVRGSGWSSPVLANGRIYLTSAVTANEGDRAITLRALCLDAANGNVVWNTEVIRPDEASAAAMHRKNSPASATPVLTSDRLYVHFGHMGTAALDLDGRVLWRQTELKYSPVHGNGGSPALVDDLLVLNCDGGSAPFVAALDVKTGAVRWKTPRNSTARKLFSFSTPLAIKLNGATEIISAASGFVAAYAPPDGRELWRVKYGEGYSVVPRPVFAHDMIYISSGFDQPVLYAIKPHGASGDATGTHVAWTHRKGVPCTSSMLVLGDDLFFVSDAGIASCLDAKTGAVCWSQRLGGDFSASPTSAEGRVYFQNETGSTFVVAAKRTFELLARNEVGERTFASPAMIDGAIFIRSENHLWRIGR
jgi:outer membrane protein assembly factor BamB